MANGFSQGGLFPKLVITLDAPEQTAKLGAHLFDMSDAGDVFALYGTLGTGKTVLARGFVQEACGYEEDVPSPTFTLVQYYDAQNGLTLYHYDLYRIKEPDEAIALGIEDAFYDGVSLIEWPENLGGYLPAQYFSVTLDYDRTKAGEEGQAARVATIAANRDYNDGRLEKLAQKLNEQDIPCRIETTN